MRRGDALRAYGAAPQWRSPSLLPSAVALVAAPLAYRTCFPSSMPIGFNEARVDGRGLPLVVDDVHRARATAALVARAWCPPDRLSAESRAAASSEPHSSPTRRPAGGARGEGDDAVAAAAGREREGTAAVPLPPSGGGGVAVTVAAGGRVRQGVGQQQTCSLARDGMDYRHGMQWGGGRRRSPTPGRRRCAALHAAPQSRIAG